MDISHFLQRALAITSVLGSTACSLVYAQSWQTVTSADADIAVSIDDGATVFEPGARITWTIVITNMGPGDTLAQVFDTFPNGAAGVAWTCVADGSAICSAGGQGNLSDVVYLPSGATLTYLASATITAAMGSTLSNTVLAGTLNGVVDPVGGNNVATDTDQIQYFNAPVVLRLNSAASPGNCLSDGLETRTGITQLLVRFSQPMLDPAGSTDPHDVTNPSNYRVIEAGPNGQFESAGCADAPAGDDRQIAISSVDYAAASFQAALHVDANSKALPGGRYQVLACGSALQNAFGVPLDGSATGNGGSDYHSEFKVLGTNILVNPNFDYSLDNGWNASDPVYSYTSNDVDGTFSSGSLAQTAGFLGHPLTQCVGGLSAGTYVFGGRALNYLAEGVAFFGGMRTRSATVSAR